jgi:ADP-ribose pyrophosphatase YjhB (NUDIX family)
VFDVPGYPHYTAVCPGGGIEEGETVAETAVREVKEETGIDVVFVREVGSAEDPVGHYVQVAPTERLPDTWEHDGRACRWVPVRSDVVLWGRRGDFVDALVRKRVVGFVTRGRELLVFDYGEVTEVPGGRIDFDETLEEGLAREVEEETGVTGLQIVGLLADADEADRLYGVLAHRTWAFHALAPGENRDEWEHHVTGSGMDADMVFVCRFVQIDECPPLWGRPDPLVERLRGSIAEE